MAVFVSIATILVGLVIWRLSSAPLSLDPVKDWLVDALLDGGQVTLALGETSVVGWLARTFSKFAPATQARRCRRRRAERGRGTATCFSALVTGRLAPLELHLSQPWLACCGTAKGVGD